MKFVDDLLAETLRHVNDGLPRRAARFMDLLRMDTPYVETIGGERHYFNKRELETLVKLLPDDIAANLHLPFVFTKKHDLEESVYIIRSVGSEPEAFKKLMGISHLPVSGGEYYTYKPIIAEFIRRYPSLAAVGYV